MAHSKTNPPRSSPARPQIFTCLSSILRWVKLFFTPSAILFLFISAWQSWPLLTNLFSQASYEYFIAAIFIWMLLHLVSPFFSLLVLSACGSHLPYWRIFSIHASRLPARYIPGGIWHTVARVADYHSLGIQSNHLTAFVVFENALSVGVSFSLGGFIVAWTKNMGIWQQLGMAGMCCGVAVLVSTLFITNRWILKQPGHILCSNYFKIIGTILLFWIIASTAFLLYLNAFPGAVEKTSLLEVGGNYMFSWGIGFIAIFAPQGIGVFEVVMGDIIHSPLPFGGIAVLLAGFRVAVLIADIALWGLVTAGRFYFGKTTG